MTKQRKQGRRNLIAASYARDNRTYFVRADDNDYPSVEAVNLNSIKPTRKVGIVEFKRVVTPQYSDIVTVSSGYREPMKPRGNYRVIRYNSLGKDLTMDKRRRHEYLKDLRVGKQHRIRSLRQQHLIEDASEDMMCGMLMD